MIKIKNILTSLILLVSIAGYSQINYTSMAYGFYQEKNFDSAQVYIDSAVVSVYESNFSKTWQLRGVIYRNLEETKGVSARETAIESFVKSKEVDTLNEFDEQIANYLYSINIRYYNDAVAFLTANELESAEKSYTTYKSNFDSILFIKQDFTKQDVEFYTVLGGAWFKRNVEVDYDKKPEVYNNAIKAFSKALLIDSLNYSANYGIGISYYNQGADFITTMNPFETSLDEINSIQNKSIEMFKSGEPYLKRAFKINPNEKEVVEGLTGIYYSLNEDDEYNYFKSLLEKMEE
jgi:hypothetical protein